MIDTSLILIEGLTGSGKSTTAKILAETISSQVAPCRFFHELARDHPIDVGNMAKMDEVVASSVDRLPGILESWKELAEQASRTEEITIIESRLWQTGVMLPYLAGEPVERVADIYRRIVETIEPAKPVLIRLKDEDLRRALERTFELKNRARLEAGGEGLWEDRMLGIFERQPWARDRGLTGREAWFTFFEEWSAITDRLFERFPFPKLEITDPHEDWDRSIARAESFLGLDPQSS